MGVSSETMDGVGQRIYRELRNGPATLLYDTAVTRFDGRAAEIDNNNSILLEYTAGGCEA